MSERVQNIVAILGLVVFVSLAIGGLMYMISDISGKTFQIKSFLFALAMLWLVISGCYLYDRWQERRHKNPRKQ